MYKLIIIFAAILALLGLLSGCKLDKKFYKYKYKKHRVEKVEPTTKDLPPPYEKAILEQKDLPPPYER